jgi:hypothetical protein
VISRGAASAAPLGTWRRAFHNGRGSGVAFMRSNQQVGIDTGEPCRVE